MQSFEIILEKVQQVRNKINQTEALAGTLLTVSVGLILFSVFGLFEGIYYLPKFFRNITLGISTAIVLAFFFWKIFLPFGKIFGFVKKQTDEEIAKFIGLKRLEIADRLLNSIQLFKEFSEKNISEGKIFVERAIKNSADQIQNLDLTLDVDQKPVKNSSKIFVTAVGIFLLPFLLLGNIYLKSFDRIFSPTKDFAPPAEFALEVFPKNIKVLKGDSLFVSAKGIGDLPLQINLVLTEGIRKDTRVVTLDSDSTYKIRLDGVRDNFLYKFAGTKENKFGKITQVVTPSYKVTVQERPFVRFFKAKVISPGYSRIPLAKLPPNTGEIIALKGSKVEIDLSANNILKEAEIRFGKFQTAEMKIGEQFASADFTVLEDDVYSFHLRDQNGIESINPINYRIVALEDEFPLIKLVYPSEDITLNENLEVPIATEIMDDYGFSKLLLKYAVKKFDSNEEALKFTSKRLPLDKTTVTFAQVQELWELKSLGLQPEDEVIFYLEVYDNDTVSGPKKTATEKIRLRYPSIDEIFAQFEEEQMQVEETFEELIEKSQDLEEFMEKTTREFKKEQELDWQEKKKLEESLEAQKELNENIEEMAQKMQEMVEELEKNNLISEQILEKYQELQEVMQEIVSPEIKKAMEELQKALEQQNPQEIEQAMENFQMSQEEYLDQLERSLELFKNIQLEQKLDELAQRAEELSQKQVDLNEETAKSDSTDTKNNEKLADEQKALAEEEKQMEELAKEVEELFKDTKNKTPEAFQEATDQLEQAQTQQKMQESSEQLQQGQKQQAQQNQQQQTQEMQQFATQMRQAQQQFEQQQLDKMLSEMGKLVQNMLEISRQQEALKNESATLQPRSPRMNESAKNQSDLTQATKQSTQKLSELSKKSFFISSGLLGAMGQSIEEMEEATQSLGDNKGRQASKNQERATQGINQAILQMNQAMQSMQMSGSASGMEQYMEALQQMAGQQQGLNGQTQGMMGMQPGGQQGQKPGGMQPGGQQGQGQGGNNPSPLGMGSLAAQQKALQEALESLQQKMERGGSGKPLGDLGEIGKEMGEIAKELKERNASQKTVRKQQRVLSRLLDAQRSVNKEKLSRKRKSRTAEFFTRKNVGNLPENLGQKQNTLREDLLKALEEGYNKNYQEIIKTYFDALQKQQ
ncbi:MAG: DUF4175 family protein [Calditrichaeota bacterium]|nr:MAG: DUF4175 family protein [Calditrichota bacterium]